MRVTFRQEIDAEVTVIARLSSEGEFSAVAAATCAYAEGELEGATASASVAVPDDIAQDIRRAMEAALEKIGDVLGAKLAQSKAEAYRVSVQQGEIR